MPLKQKLLQQKSLPVPPPHLWFWGCLVWPGLRVPAPLDVLEMKHGSVFATLDSPIGMFVVLPAVPDSMHMDRAFPKRERGGGGRSRVDYSVVNGSVWLQNQSLAGLKGKDLTH